MEANREDAHILQTRSRAALDAGDLRQALNLLERSHRMYPVSNRSARFLPTCSHAQLGRLGHLNAVALHIVIYTDVACLHVPDDACVRACIKSTR